MRFVFTLLLVLLGAGRLLAAATTPVEAMVVSIVGANATVRLPDGSSRALKEADSLPRGAVVSTGADTVVTVRAMIGAASAIQPDSRVALEEMSVTTDNGKVTKNKAVLEVQQGDLVSVIDPTTKDINDYNVRTPQGVFTAEGTVIHIKVAGQDAKVTTAKGVVRYQTSAGTYRFYADGRATFNGQPVANNLIAAILTPGVAAAIASAVGQVAGNPQSFGASPATAVAEMKSVIATLVKAVPQATSSIVASAVAGVQKVFPPATVVRSDDNARGDQIVNGLSALGSAVLKFNAASLVAEAALAGSKGLLKPADAVAAVTAGVKASGGVAGVNAESIVANAADTLGGDLAKAAASLSPPKTTPTVPVVDVSIVSVSR